MVSKLKLMFFFFHLISIVVLALDLSKLHGNISNNPSDIKAASLDFGNMRYVEALAVMYPNSAHDIVELIKKSYQSEKAFPVSPKGSGHSLYGQAQVADGVVIDMTGTKVSLQERKQPAQGSKGSYVDVWGGDLWVNVLNWTVTYGLAPKSWTNYLYVTVGGTLSNAGVGGQSYIHGPQISNVYELDVVTGKGELKTCSKDENSELFYSVLGGLGQFGIITRARIALEPAPECVVLIHLMYLDFSIFTKDIEYLISLHEKPANERFDSIHSSVLIDQGGVRYVLEVVKYFSKLTEDTVRQEIIETLLKKLDFIPSSTTSSISLTYFDFLDQLRQMELDLRRKGLLDVPHPWITLLVPKSKIGEFDKGIFKGILGSNSNGWIVMKPLLENKWDVRTSVVLPDEDIFYAILMLRSAIDTGEGTKAKLDFIINQNREIIKFCKENELGVKGYMAHHETQEEWIEHYGDKWDLIYKRKIEFDPKHILGTGQHIFQYSSVFREGISSVNCEVEG
ncbi:hypothetical protein GIB67_011057 [Kingdonia uniflora]|uniref:cytokinin dehydrogenase n=1 Tax=Kingdonia uniflora TaxID=39325 RepID=A0A7J7L6I6_9MAGN|nr:hypothetical protein GIB67_011057 [Kingdonia uniflora]